MYAKVDKNRGILYNFTKEKPNVPIYAKNPKLTCGCTIKDEHLFPRLGKTISLDSAENKGWEIVNEDIQNHDE